MNVISWVCCVNVLFNNVISLCYGTLFPMHDVIVCILLAICNSDVLHVESVMPGLKPLGGIKMLCEVFCT